jgi:diguanylate cyclase
VDHVARTFGTLAALTLERVQAVRSLLEESLRDELTGLGNRRAANRALDRLRPGDAVAIADLDHLKELNDTEGHAAGDELLRAFAEQLASSLREGDVASRLGGDEFLLVLRGVGDNAEAIVGRLAERWRSTSPMASFSAGVTVSSGEGDGDAALERADAALYAAKRAGRDRVVSSAEPAEVNAAPA